MKSIEEILFMYQLNNNFTQSDMAIMLNVSQATYNNWINRKTVIADKYYPVIAKICEIEAENPFSYKRPTNSNIPLSNSINESPEFSALKIYQKFTQHLEDQITYLKDRATELQSRLHEKETLLKTQQDEINLLRKQIL